MRVAHIRLIALGAAALALVPTFWVAMSTPAWGPSAFTRHCQDGMVFRSVAQLIAAGRSPYDVAQLRAAIERDFMDGAQAPELLPFAYPPTAFPLLLLHGIGTPAQGYMLVVAGSTLAMLLAFWLWLGGLQRGAQGDRSATRCHVAERAVALAAIGSSGIAWLNTVLGQTGCFLAALAFVSSALLGSRPALAGAALGLTLFKPQYTPFLCLVPLVEGRRRASAYFVGTALALTVLSAAWFGPSRFVQWLAALGHPNASAKDMANWVAPLLRWRLVPLAASGVASLCVMGASLLVLAWLLRRSLVHGRSDAATRARFALAASVATLCSPNTHPYDLFLWCLALGCVPLRMWLAACVFCVGSWAVLVFYARYLLPLCGLSLAFAAHRAIGRGQSAAVRGPSE